MIKTTSEIRDIVYSDPSYSFLFTNEHLRNGLVLLGLGGSYAYGTATENSDIDVRGIALRSKEEILTGKDFEQVTDSTTDTTIYSLDKICKLMLNCNPNVIEIFGLAPDQYVYANVDFMREFIWLKDAFLSKRCIKSFGGYATSQLRRLENKSAREVGEKQREQHVLDSIKYASDTAKAKMLYLKEGSLNFYVDAALTPERESELFIDCDIKHYPLREFCAYINTCHSVVRDYDKLEDTKRNRCAIAHDKLDKHTTHLIRLYYMVFDILEYHEVVTYRDKEHEFLNQLRNGLYIDENKQPKPELFELVDKLEDKLQKLAKTTTLPDEPDYDLIYKWIASVNERIVLGRLS